MSDLNQYGGENCFKQDSVFSAQMNCLELVVY